MKVIALLAAIFAGISTMAGIRYVNLDGNDGYDGKAPVWDGTHGPKKTIQAAVYAADPGDTVSVAPGVYGDEQGSTDKETAGTTCRVWIDRPITLNSEVKGGAVLVGRPADDPQGAVSAIRVASTVATSAADPVEISGFVIRDCADDDASIIGGVIGWAGSVTPTLANGDGPWVVDCVISNCSVSCNGVLGRVNAVRTLLQDNSGEKPGVIATHCNLMHSVFVGLRGQAGLYCGTGTVLINCTIVGGSHNAMSSSNKATLYNVLVTGGAGNGTYAAAAYDSVLLATVSSGEGCAAGSQYNKGQLAAPNLDDFRPLAKTALSPDAEACGRGKRVHLDLIPEKYRTRDFLGNEIPADAVSINAGAVQASVTPVAAFVANESMTDPTQNINIGRPIKVNNTTSFDRYFYLGATDWPRAFELSSALGENDHLFAYKGVDAADSGNVSWFFPDRLGRILFVPPQGVLIRLSLQKAAKVRYVASNGDDVNNNGQSSDSPFATLQKAVDDVGTSCSVIYVGKGTYAEGATTWDSNVNNPKVLVKLASNRQIRMVASDFLANGDATSTTIRGGADDGGDANGNGPNATRCIRVNSSAICCIQGFTITNGHTGNDGYASHKNGAAFMCETAKNAWLMDCVVTGNYAFDGGAAMYGGKAARCRFYGNSCPSSHFYNFEGNDIWCRLADCVIASDEGSASRVVVSGRAQSFVNCTFYSPAARSKVISSNDHGYFFNCLIVNNDSIGTVNSACIAGNVLENTPYSSSANPLNVEPVAYTRGSALLVDPDHADFHVATVSAAVGAGTAWGGLADATRWNEGVAYSNFYALVQHDMDGNGMNLVNGKPTAGAYQRPSKHVMVVTANLPSHVDEDSVGTKYVGFGETITLAAKAKDGRQVVGYCIGGKTLAGATCEMTTPGPEAAALIDVQVLVNTNWYADATAGSDANHGWSETDAFLTLAGAMGVAESGDIVIALPGTYRKKSMVQDVGLLDGDNKSLPSRVVVKDGVALVSRDGASSTVIEGVTPADTFGEGAVRCVYMRPGTTLRGFTVTGGSTFGFDSTKAGDDYAAGGVFCAEAPDASVEPSIWVCDCIISNNSARTYAGGAYYGGGFVRCRFLGNRCQSSAGGVSMASRLCECVIDFNVGTTACATPYRTRSCTFGANNKTWAGNPSSALTCDPGSSEKLWPVWNSLFLGGLDCKVRCAYNCIVPRDGFLKTDKASQCLESVVPAAVEVDADYAPAYESKAANAANMDYVLPVELEGDVYGNPRRSNGGMDLGAVEKDWRPRYAADLGRRVTVTSADWTVVEGESGTVRLPDGATLSVEWSIRSLNANPSVRFTVAEGATLTVVRAGCDPAVFGPDEGEFKLENPQPLESLSFVADGGTVELASMRSNGGMVLIVR